jgi:hypothetical protein
MKKKEKEKDYTDVIIDVEPEVYKTLVEEAKRLNISFNQLCINILEDKIKQEQEKRKRQEQDKREKEEVIIIVSTADGVQRFNGSGDFELLFGNSKYEIVINGKRK